MRAEARLALSGLIALATGLAGCSGEAASGLAGAPDFDSMSTDEHLACTIDISAYTYLLAAGTIPQDRAMAGNAALAAGWHQNAYATAPGADKNADLVNRKRAELLAKDSPQTITKRAAACIDVALARHLAD